MKRKTKKKGKETQTERGARRRPNRDPAQPQAWVGGANTNGPTRTPTPRRGNPRSGGRTSTLRRSRPACDSLDPLDPRKCGPAWGGVEGESARNGRNGSKLARERENARVGVERKGVGRGRGRAFGAQRWRRREERNRGRGGWLLRQTGARARKNRGEEEGRERLLPVRRIVLTAVLLGGIEIRLLIYLVITSVVNIQARSHIPENIIERKVVRNHGLYRNISSPTRALS